MLRLTLLIPVATVTGAWKLPIGRGPFKMTLKSRVLELQERQKAT